MITTIFLLWGSTSSAEPGFKLVNREPSIPIGTVFSCKETVSVWAGEEFLDTSKSEWALSTLKVTGIDTLLLQPAGSVFYGNNALSGAGIEVKKVAIIDDTDYLFGRGIVLFDYVLMVDEISSGSNYRDIMRSPERLAVRLDQGGTGMIQASLFDCRKI